MDILDTTVRRTGMNVGTNLVLTEVKNHVLSNKTCKKNIFSFSFAGIKYFMKLFLKVRNKDSLNIRYKFNMKDIIVFK